MINSNLSSSRLKTKFSKINKPLLSLGMAFFPGMFFMLPTTGWAAGYSVSEIPIPQQITVPAGNVPFPVCLGLNDVGQVACHLEIVPNQQPTQADRFSPRLKVLASYVYKWDSNAPRSATNPLLLSSTSATSLDKASAINNSGIVAGSSDTTTTKKPQGTLWSDVGATQFGPGAITKINDNGDYILAGKLFVNSQAASFPGGRVQVQAMNNSGAGVAFKPAGTQSFSSKLGQSGTGILFSQKPAANLPQPWFGISAIVSGVGVTDISDNGNFVVSGIPQTAGGLAAFSCFHVNVCNVYFPSVVNGGRVIPYITLNAVDNAGTMVGTDGGFALMIKPSIPIASAINAPVPVSKIDLNTLLPAGSSTQGWFLNEATDINRGGQIIGLGLKNSRRIGFLLTPIP